MKFPEQFRFQTANPHYRSNPGDTFGNFQVSARNANGRTLNIIAIDGQETGWEHVSVSLLDNQTKCPSWDEMCLVKRLFWDDDECVVEFHPPSSKYVNTHVGVLHLWKCVNEEFPMPPMICV